MRPGELDKNSYVSASVTSMLALPKGKVVTCKDEASVGSALCRDVIPD
jgi:hypothetical protein